MTDVEEVKEALERVKETLRKLEDAVDDRPVYEKIQDMFDL